MSQRDTLSDITTAALERGLSGLYARQMAIADNLANIETPRYQAKSVRFEDSLYAAIKAERSLTGQRSPRRAHIEDVRPQVEYHGTPRRRDGNTVNIETETVAMANTSLHYQILSRLLSKKLHMLRRAINGSNSQ